MKFRAPAVDSDESDGEHFNNSSEDDNYYNSNTFDEPSSILLLNDGASEYNNGNTDDELLGTLPSTLSNLQLIYQSPSRDRTAAELKELLVTTSCATAPPVEYEAGRLLLNRLQFTDPILTEFECQRKQLAVSSSEAARRKLENAESQFRKHHPPSRETVSALQQHQSMVQQLADQLMAEEKARLLRLKAEFQRAEQEQEQLVSQAVNVVRERQRQLDEKRRMEEEQLAEEKRKQVEVERRLAEEKHQQAEQERRRAEEETLRRLEAERIQATAQLAAQQRQQTIEKNYGSAEAMADAKRLIEQLASVKQTIGAQVNANRAMFTEALRYRMQFTTKIGAVTNSRKHITQFYGEINGILVSGKQTSDALYTWLLNNLAKQFVAYPLGLLAALLCAQHTQLVEYLRGRLYKKCPVLIPEYPKRLEGETDEQLKIRMGYRQSGGDGGGLETELHFQERCYGMIAFYASLLQSDLTSFGNVTNPHGLQNGWRYLARLLNMTPRKIAPGALETFLRVAGNRLLSAYGRQAHKLIRYIHDTFMPLIKSPGSEGAKVRLQLFLEEYLRAGRSIPPHEGNELRP